MPEDRFVGVHKVLIMLVSHSLASQARVILLICDSDLAGQTELEVVPLQVVRSLPAAAFLPAGPLLDWRARPW